MGPLIPNGIIPEDWNNFIALVIGIVFGYILENSGFSSSKKLAGVFYGYDFAVIKVFFTTAAVSIIGLLYLDYLGYLNMSSLYVHPTYFWAAIIGGIIMGIGFVAGGYCPGTSLCAVAIGKIDAMIFVLGSMVGIFIFSEFYSSVFQPLYDGSFLGNLTLVDTFNISPYWISFIFTLVALLTFFMVDKIQVKVRAARKKEKKLSSN